MSTLAEQIKKGKNTIGLAATLNSLALGTAGAKAAQAQTTQKLKSANSAPIKTGQNKGKKGKETQSSQKGTQTKQEDNGKRISPWAIASGMATPEIAGAFLEQLKPKEITPPKVGQSYYKMQQDNDVMRTLEILKPIVEVQNTKLNAAQKAANALEKTVIAHILLA